MSNERRPENTEAPRTVELSGKDISFDPIETFTLNGLEPIFKFHLYAVIAAVQNAGYLVYEIGDLPEVTTTENGNTPKLPAHWGATKRWVDNKWIEVSRVQAYYEEAFGKLALARWYEKDAERREKRIGALRRDIQDVPSRTYYATDDTLAIYLVDLGWRRG